MNLDDLMGLSQRLNQSMETLAAVAAELRIQSESLKPHPEVRRLLASIVERAGMGNLSGVSDDQKQSAVGMIRAFFRQASDLMDRPDADLAWTYDDPIVLQSQGRASMIVAALIRKIGLSLPGFDEALSRNGAAFLDIGTGVAWLAVAMVRTYPQLRVVGIDTWGAALALARKNVQDSSLGHTIELRREDATALEDEKAFDLVWMPGPFLPHEIVPDVLTRAFRAMRPGAWIVFGLYAASDDAMSSELLQLRVLRSGGHPWSASDAEALLKEHGFTNVHTPERTWQSPMLFAFGQKPA